MASSPNTFSIDSFVGAIHKSGSRANLFKVNIATPSDLQGATLLNGSTPETKWEFLVNATTLPGYLSGEIPVSYYGRVVYFAGDTTFGDWTVTVLNDEDMKIRKGVETWMEKINSTHSNVRDADLIEHKTISTKATIETFGMDGITGKGTTKVELFNVWPSNISPIELSHDSANAIETFQVTWQYNYAEHSNITV
jgi:hypothetical protein